ncbi:hypothetical protein [Bacillus xiapuensis]|uniref:Uncharacterized protein n=1 Tax=Bacillus xiapuensis TaxID=2014075 RepID=A0ABU6N5K1_9BACI|nr:hypothetical protein [Bacillus xiapuensis]
MNERKKRLQRQMDWIEYLATNATTPEDVEYYTIQLFNIRKKIIFYTV